MKYSVAYGKTDLQFELSQQIKADVITSPFISGLKDDTAAITKSLQNPIDSYPLKELAAKSNKIAIVVNDITRATPYKKILPALLRELVDIADEQIIFFVATGSHRANTKDELASMLGQEIIERFAIIQNDAKDMQSHAYVGQTQRGNKVYIHNEYLKCDLKILTGFIEPHFFAGFSGGPKACVPGLAGLETIMNNHKYEYLNNKNATWGMTKSNPLWEELYDAALLAGKPFMLNVALNSNKEIIGVFGGDIDSAHEKGCQYVKQHSMVKAKHRYDIVISSNSGFPLDLNLYQSVKGISAASQIVKKGRAIIIVADCWDGIPQHGNFGKILEANKNPQELIEKIEKGEFNIQDSWQAYILCRICALTDCYCYSDNLTDEQIKKCFLQPCRDIGQSVNILIKKYGGQAKICILPHGPLTIPYISED